MTFSSSTGYGLLAVDYIAKNPNKIVLPQTIAEEYNIPLEFLQEILQQLVSANILRNKRGPTECFSLAKPAEQISMLEIVEAIEGPIIAELYLNEGAPNNKIQGRVQKIYGKGLSEIKSVLEKTKLSDML